MNIKIRLKKALAMLICASFSTGPQVAKSEISNGQRALIGAASGFIIGASLARYARSRVNSNDHISRSSSYDNSQYVQYETYAPPPETPEDRKLRIEEERKQRLEEEKEKILREKEKNAEELREEIKVQQKTSKYFVGERVLRNLTMEQLSEKDGKTQDSFLDNEHFGPPGAITDNGTTYSLSNDKEHVSSFLNDYPISINFLPALSLVSKWVKNAPKSSELMGFFKNHTRAMMTKEQALSFFRCLAYNDNSRSHCIWKVQIINENKTPYQVALDRYYSVLNQTPNLVTTEMLSDIKKRHAAAKSFADRLSESIVAMDGLDNEFKSKHGFGHVPSQISYEFPFAGHFTIGMTYRLKNALANTQGKELAENTIRDFDLAFQQAEKEYYNPKPGKETPHSWTCQVFYTPQSTAYFVGLSELYKIYKNPKSNLFPYYEKVIVASLNYAWHRQCNGSNSIQITEAKSWLKREIDSYDLHASEFINQTNHSAQSSLVEAVPQIAEYLDEHIRLKSASRSLSTILAISKYEIRQLEHLIESLSEELQKRSSHNKSADVLGKSNFKLPK